MPQDEIISNNEEETRAFGAQLSRRLESGDTLLLEGPLGAGKTCLVKGLCQGLGIDPGEASSPSFTLIQEYTGGRLKVFHVDLYRLQPEKGLESLGLEEIFGQAGSVCLVEWPDKLGGFAPEKARVVEIERLGETARKIRVFDAEGGQKA